MRAVVYDRYGPPDVLRSTTSSGPSPRTTKSASGSTPRRSAEPTPGFAAPSRSFPALSPVCSDRSGGSSAATWPEKSRQSAPASPSSRSGTASSASIRGSSARTRSSSACGQSCAGAHAGRHDLRGGGGGLRRGDPGAERPETGSTSGRDRGSSSMAPPDRSARPGCSWPDTSVPTSPPCATRRTSSS